jgi:hypothetical protein
MSSHRNPKPSLDQATDARLDEIRDVLMSGAGEFAGKTMREIGEHQDDQGKIMGRFRGFSHAYPELVKYQYPRQTLLRALSEKKGKVYERLRRASRDVMEYEGFMERKKRSPEKPTVGPHSGNIRCKHCGVMHAKGQHRFHGTGSFHKTHLFSFGESMENPGKGRGFLFFGSFTSKLAARRKEANVPGAFIREKHGRYYVLKARQTTTRRVSNPKKLVTIYGRVLKVEAQKIGPHRNCDAECKRCDHKYVHDFKVGAKMYGLPDGSILIKKG